MADWTAGSFDLAVHDDLHGIDAARRELRVEDGEALLAVEAVREGADARDPGLHVEGGVGAEQQDADADDEGDRRPLHGRAAPPGRSSEVRPAGLAVEEPTPQVRQLEAVDAVARAG